MLTSKNATGIFTKTLLDNKDDKIPNKVFALNEIQQKTNRTLDEVEQNTKIKIKRPTITAKHTDESILYDSYAPVFVEFTIKYNLINTQKIEIAAIHLQKNMNNKIQEVCDFILRNHPQKEEIITLEAQTSPEENISTTVPKI